MAPENQLPTWDEIVTSTLTELDAARNGLSEAASWLRSDWRPLGSPLPDAGAAARAEVMDLIGKAKALIDQAKGGLHRARGEPS